MRFPWWAAPRSGRPFSTITFPYMALHGAIVVREATRGVHVLSDLKGRRVAVMKGDNAEEFLRREDRGIHIVTTATFEDALKELSEGRYDCALVPRISSLYLIEKNGWENLILGNQSFFAGKYAYAVPDGQSALLAQFSEGLKIIEQSGEYRRIYEKWLGVYQGEPLSLIKALRYSILALGPLVLVLLGFLIWSWSLRNQVGRKTRELQESVDRFK